MRKFDGFTIFEFTKLFRINVIIQILSIRFIFVQDCKLVLWRNPNKLDLPKIKYF